MLLCNAQCGFKNEKLLIKEKYSQAYIIYPLCKITNIAALL